VGDELTRFREPPPVSLFRIVTRTEGYTYAAKVWDVSIVEGPFSVAPCQTLIVRIAFFALTPEIKLDFAIFHPVKCLNACLVQTPFARDTIKVSEAKTL
jgi:hypothetical protein